MYVFKNLKQYLQGGVQPATGIKDGKVNCVFGCVTDAKGPFVEQAARLLLSLRWFGGELAKNHFVLAVVGELSSHQRNFFDRQKAQIVEVDVFDSRHGPSNKLRFFEIDELDRYDSIVLLDCDTLIVQDPSNWVRCQGFAAKPADLPTVKVESLTDFLKSENLQVPELSYRHDVADVPGLPYFNSGVIIISKGWRKKLVNAWKKFDITLLERAEEFDIRLFHVDQASLTAALLSEEIPISVLPSAMNFPAHLSVDRYTQSLFETDPVIIHYHQFSDSNGYIESLPFPAAGLRARMFNARLRAERSISLAPPRRKKRRDKSKIVVGSGWWSSDEFRDWTIGAPITRSAAFFDIWYRQVMKCIAPDRVFVTDSKAPIKPEWRAYPYTHWIELDQNYGHPNDLRTGHVQTKFSGYTRSVINGAMHAFCCDADYYVYVEQDCLIRGVNFLEKAIGDNTADILLGARTEGGTGIEGKQIAPMYQNSLIIVRKTGLERFIKGILDSPVGDGEMSIEVIMERHCAPFGVISIPFGRSRPIDFSNDCFYIQHMTDDELRQFLDTEGATSQVDWSVNSIFNL